MNSLTKLQWRTLHQRIENGECTPFLGAGACFGRLPLGTDLAKEWHTKFLPIRTGINKKDLSAVSQHMVLHGSDMKFVKDQISNLIKSTPIPDFKMDELPHGYLAALPLKVYITTNYDDFMAEALRRVGKKPQVAICKWNKYIYTDRVNPPTIDSPLVFHLHGHYSQIESLVLTEDDYLDFLTAINKKLLPACVQEALVGTSLLFLGYSLQDVTFKVLYRGLFKLMESSFRLINISVQLAPKDRSKQLMLAKYFEKDQVSVYWGTVLDFIKDLRNNKGNDEISVQRASSLS